MNLRDGSRSERARIYLRKHLLNRTVVHILQAFHDLGKLHRSGIRPQLFKLNTVILRQYIGVKGQDLAKLNKRGSQIFQD